MLQECYGLLHAGCPRREPRAHGFDALGGPWRPLACTSSAPMALRGPGGSVRGKPRGLREVPWDAEPMRWPAPALVAEAMNEPAGGLMGDETGFGTKGTDAVGVA